jgi:hypothetical protein
MSQKGLLQASTRISLRQSLDGGDLMSGSLSRRHQASAYRFAIEQDGACPAVAGIASHFGSGQAEVVA